MNSSVNVTIDPMLKMTLVFIEFIVAILLIISVLMHSAKGEGLAGIGGQANVFNTPKGMEDGLTRLTTVLATLFLVIGGVLGILF